MQDHILSTTGDALSTLVVLAQIFIFFKCWKFSEKNLFSKNIVMEYQMLTCFDKFTFSGLLFSQVAISYLSSTPCQNARFPVPHCQVINFTLWNCWLHIASATLPTFQIDVIFGQPLFKKFNILPNTLNSFLWFPNKIFVGFFTHLHSALTSYPPRLPT